jgi:antitoxin ParD1/3/4
MNITLAPDSEAYLQEQLAAGKFPSADVLVSEALRLMRDHERKLDELRRDIAVGIAQADQGLLTAFDESLLEKVKARARQSA